MQYNRDLDSSAPNGEGALHPRRKLPSVSSIELRPPLQRHHIELKQKVDKED